MYVWGNIFMYEVFKALGKIYKKFLSLRQAHIVPMWKFKDSRSRSYDLLKNFCSDKQMTFEL